MVRVALMPRRKAAEEYQAWCDEAREWYDERLAIMSDGGAITPETDWAARFEARRVHCETVSKLASHWDGVSFSFGIY